MYGDDDSGGGDNGGDMTDGELSLREGGAHSMLFNKG